MYANTQNTSSHDIIKHLFSPYSMPESCLDFVYIYITLISLFKNIFIGA